MRNPVEQSAEDKPTPEPAIDERQVAKVAASFIGRSAVEKLRLQDAAVSADHCFKYSFSRVKGCYADGRMLRLGGG